MLKYWNFLFSRIGTCGGIGLEPGSVVVTNEAVDGQLRPVSENVTTHFFYFLGIFIFFTCGTQVLKQRLKTPQVPPPGNHFEVFRQACFT